MWQGMLLLSLLKSYAHGWAPALGRQENTATYLPQALIWAVAAGPQAG